MTYTADGSPPPPPEIWSSPHLHIKAFAPAWPPATDKPLRRTSQGSWSWKSAQSPLLAWLVCPLSPLNWGRFIIEIEIFLASETKFSPFKMLLSSLPPWGEAAAEVNLLFLTSILSRFIDQKGHSHLKFKPSAFLNTKGLSTMRHQMVLESTSVLSGGSNTFQWFSYLLLKRKTAKNPPPQNSNCTLLHLALVRSLLFNFFIEI